MKVIVDELVFFMSEHNFLIASMVSLVVLLVIMSKRRVSFLVPLIILSIAILNPMFYNVWGKLGYAYWRILWIIPIIPICAALPPAIMEKIDKKYFVFKVAVLEFFLVVCICLGSFIYNEDYGYFKFSNIDVSKVPIEAIEVSDYLLSLEENPRAVVDSSLIEYIRQYTGKIELLYGRWEFVINPSRDAYTVLNQLQSEEKDLSIVAEIMLNNEYKYLVVKDNDISYRNQLNENGFELINRIDGYGVYEIYGSPSIIKEKNKLGQVISVTTLDEMGNPIENEFGYSTISYEYDKNGNVTKEYYTDIDGNLVSDKTGYAGYEKKYDFKNREVSLIRIDDSGEQAEMPAGYTEKRTKYGIRKRVYSYYDSDGNPIMTSEGYSSLKCSYDKNNRLIREEYFDEVGEPHIKPAGYTGVEYKYNKYGQISEMVYLNEKKNPIKRIDGYSSVKWIDNEETGSRDVAFYNLSDDQISLESLNLVRGLKTGADGWSSWMIPAKNTVNSCFYIGTVNLGRKVEGDKYTCYICIEFENVMATEGQIFGFCTQGATDGEWEVKNVWNPSLIWLNTPPEDGMYIFKVTESVNEAMTHASEYNIGFRGDNWSSGRFRVRDVMIVKGEEMEEWKPGL